MTLAVLGENRMTIRKTFAPRSLLLLLFVSSLVVTIPVSADTTSTKDRTITKLADNIYEIRHPDAPDTFPQGNTTVIIGDKSVLVVDSCLLPSSAQADIDQIRKWTKKPVTFLVNTHWHFDHTLGNQTYAQAFPGIQIIARAHSDAEVEHLKSLGANLIIMGEREIALGIIQNLFEWQARSPAAQA